MATKDIVYESLKTFGTCTAKSLSCYIKRTTGEDISSNSVSGTLRGLVNHGKVGRSNTGGSTVYWAIKE